MGYRTRDEIFASILRSSAKNKEGTRFTRIMYDSFLSYTQISQYLNEVIRFGLLINEPDVTKYKITEKGLRFLDLLEKIDDLLSH